MISSTAEFHLVIGRAVSSAFSDVIDQAYKELQRTMQEVVYDGYSPEDYDRTGGLLNSWKQRVSGLDAELLFEPYMLPLNPSNWQHGSQYAGGDTRGAILDILQGGYNAYNANTGTPIPSRPVWDRFLQQVDSQLDSWIRDAFRAQGLEVL